MTSLFRAARSGPALPGAAGSETAPDTEFSALVFPTLADGATPSGRGEERARLERQWQARGHAAGYTEGLRAAAVAVDARVAGLEAEHAELMRAAAQQRDRTLEVLHTAVRALETLTVPVLHDVEDTLLGAAIDLAEAIIGHALADEAAAVRSALGRTVVSGPAGSVPLVHTVRLHPHDLAVLDATTVAATGVTLVADATLSRGDAVSEFPDGYLDARIGSALQRARAVLSGAGS